MAMYTDLAEFLKAVFGSDYGTHALFANLNPPAHTRDLTRLDPGRDCYWSIAAFGPDAVTNLGDDALHTRALVIDDVGTKGPAAAAVLLALGEPSTIVESSAGNFQWGYRLSKPVAIEDWSGFFGGVETLIGHSVPLEARSAQTLMRLPMGRNTKKGRGNFAVRLVKVKADRELDPDTITRVRAAGAGPSTAGPEPRIKDIRKLMRLVPNDPEVDRGQWVLRAHQIKALAIDEDEGSRAFDEWSQKWPGYDAAETQRVWESLGDIRISGLGLLADAEAADPAGFADVMNGEARAAFDDGVQHPPPPPGGGGGGYRPTHVGAAEAVVAAGRGALGWLSNASHRWAAYDEVMGRWEVGEDDSEMRTAVRLEVERRVGMGVSAQDSVKMRGAGWRLAVQSLLVRERRLRIAAGRFDADLDVVGVPGGVLRLDKAMGLWEAEAGRAGHMVSKALAVRSKLMPCPVWDRFINDFTMGDADLRLWWQAFCGYCLTGHTTEQIVVFLYGTGGNGKSVFLDIIGEVMGDYHVRADHRLFMAKVGGFHLAPLAALEGARLVTCPDVGVNAVWDVGLVKAISGGGLITANRMRENSVSFEPQCKVVLAGNEKPRLDNVDAGVKRRFQLVPATAVPKRVDKLLMEKLRAERGGILEWMLRGWEMWALGGLPLCAAIESETKSYLDGADVFGRWIGEALTAAPGDRTRHRITDLWRAWDSFRMGEGAGHCVPNRTQELSTKLKENGFAVYRDNKGAYVDGITVTKTDVF